MIKAWKELQHSIQSSQANLISKTSKCQQFQTLRGGSRGPVDSSQLLDCSCCGSSWTRSKPELSSTTEVVRITTKNPIKRPSPADLALDETMKEIALFVAAKVGGIRHHSFLVKDIISAERQRVSGGFNYKMDLKMEVTKIKMLSWVLDCNVVVFDPFPRILAKSSRLPVVPRNWFNALAAVLHGKLLN